jgi:hypothetical protein
VPIAGICADLDGGEALHLVGNVSSPAMQRIHPIYFPSSDTIRALACRESWNLVSSTCGDETRLNVAIQNTVKAEQMYPSHNAVVAGSNYDYRWITISPGAVSTLVTVKGIYITNLGGV